MEKTNKGRGKAKGITLVQKVIAELDVLEIGETMQKQPLVIKYWERFDEYTSRTFDMALHKANKQMNGKIFRQHLRIITRIS